MKQAYLMVNFTYFFQVAECAKLEDSLIDTKGKLEMSDLRIQQVLFKEEVITTEVSILINFSLDVYRHMCLKFAAVWRGEYTR